MKHAGRVSPPTHRAARPPSVSRVRAGRTAPAAAHPTAPRSRGACACGGPCPRCQQPSSSTPPLRIASPHSSLERSADRAARAVVDHRPGTAFPLRQELGSLRGPADADTPFGAPAPASVQRTLAEPGQALDNALRAPMEGLFGESFGRVRIHTDDTAAASAADIAAGAYTVGSHIVFGPGRFAPDTDAGRRLLVHELAHVVQQAGVPAGVVQRAPWDDFFAPADWGPGGGGDAFDLPWPFDNPFAPAPQKKGDTTPPSFTINAERPGDDTTTGHAWVTLDDGKGKEKGWGFYAACTPICSTLEYIEIASGNWVDGEVRDDTHARSTDKGIYFISPSKYDSGKQHIEGNKPDRYNLWQYNCVDYVRTIAAEFGITIPDFPGIDEPEELANWIASGKRGR